MSAMLPLGRSYNVATSATTAATRFNLKDAVGAGIVLIGATSGNATITEANASSGGTSQNLATGITEYYTQASGVWTKVTQAAAATVTAVAGGLLYVWVPGVQLSDGFSYIAASHSSGSFVFIIGDPTVGRYPPNLAAVTS